MPTALPRYRTPEGKHLLPQANTRSVILRLVCVFLVVQIFVALFYLQADMEGSNASDHTSIHKVVQRIGCSSLLRKSNSPDNNISPKSKEEGVGACLLIRDDNNRLIEWLAYHYLVLPLRHLIVAVDPESKTSPLPILQRWDDTDLEYILWNDKDYMSEARVQERNDREAQAKADPSSDISRVLLEENHRSRQRIFLAECYKRHKMLNHSWVIHSDTDEYIIFNTMGNDEPENTDDDVYDDDDDDDKVEGKKPLIPNPERQTLPEIGQKTILEVLKKDERDTCIGIPRLLFGAIEPTDSELSSVDVDVPCFDAKKFDTLRFLRHHVKGSKRNGPLKVIADISKVSVELLDPRELWDIHRPFEHLCSKLLGGPKVYARNIFRINHYLGSWEEYTARVGDVRRDRGGFDFKNSKATEGPSFEIRPWLANFVREVGTEKAHHLLQGAGEL